MDFSNDDPFWRNRLEIDDLFSSDAEGISNSEQASTPDPPQVSAPLQIPTPPQVSAPLQLQAPLHIPAPLQLQAPYQVPSPLQIPVPYQTPAPLHIPAPLQLQAPYQVPAPLQIPVPYQVPVPLQIPVPFSSIKFDPDPPPFVDQTRDKVLAGIEFKKQLEKKVGISIPKNVVLFLHRKVCKSLHIRKCSRREKRSLTVYYQNFASVSSILIEAFYAEILKNPYLILGVTKS